MSTRKGSADSVDLRVKFKTEVLIVSVRCASTINLVRSVLFLNWYLFCYVSVHSPMEKMSFATKTSCPTTTKPRSAANSAKMASAPMGSAASSSTRRGIIWLTSRGWWRQSETIRTFFMSFLRRTRWRSRGDCLSSKIWKLWKKLRRRLKTSLWCTIWQVRFWWTGQDTIRFECCIIICLNISQLY